MAKIVFEHVTKEFIDEKRGKVIAVNDANFTIEDKEFVVLVGPSGCGKTTTLRMIAGLERQTKGNIYIGEKLVNYLPPKDRDIAMVFQDYALYPHMTVYENLSFGLRNLKVPRTEIEQKVKRAAEILGISELLDRKPRELSGGQRQRVAVGRAIVRNPKVFLFDEPLSNLDAKLRVQMRVELAELHKKLETTIVYVTHDQVEAMTLGQRIIVMNHGIIQQIATPDELYNRPVNMFVAGFIGAPSMNFINCKVERNKIILSDGNSNTMFDIPQKFKKVIANINGKEMVMGIRPEDIYDAVFSQNIENKLYVDVYVKVVEKLGSENLIYFDKYGTTITARVNSQSRIVSGEYAKVAFNIDKIYLFDKETGIAIY
ncbi:ABC transporter related protein [Thermoanaerobacter mathranii subsp. mathranii str. A3]|uniref:ABC transporter related protein n=1 Tax=Thermoanaerobacter mathranii subsp. mathranii (strain DSM 11426 / CCUG 53645 / CIP 108742 / A3) TaxID=583358 RepID=A0ABM5LMT5_THEM3|nr:sn-glycerol-3-phosphate ABC transporter ATP-binding protein UgpC [Thermoanaerobacter mathranii]ADH60053.1 ABC transporter related protein [Thermoanaerobacter mathranii subsp. mathranii str. A3]